MSLVSVFRQGIAYLRRSTIKQIHGLVARGSTILAEHQGGQRDFSQGEFPVGMGV